MRIGDVARRTGVSVHTLRFYERNGLLPRAARSGSDSRDYSPTAIERLAFIRGAQRLGFTLAEVRALPTIGARRSDVPTWVLFEETVVDRYGLWEYMPY